MKKVLLILLCIVHCALYVGVSAQTEVKAVSITKAEFIKKVANYEANPTEWKYLGDKPCIVDFYTTWCGPCKRLAPIMDELAKEYAGEIYIYKVDTDKEQELAAVFGIRSIPTLLFCPMGENPQIAQGALPKEQLKEAIEKVLLKRNKIGNKEQGVGSKLLTSNL